MAEARIRVLGLGNILMQDDGIGVRVLESLQDGYMFSPNVELTDGGTLGLRLMNLILDADRLIVLDAVRMGSPPGTIHSLSVEELRTKVKEKQSLHQVDFLETLHYVKALGGMPHTVIIGVEPAETNPWEISLTRTVESKIGEVIRRTLEEIEKSGGRYRRRDDESIPDGHSLTFSILEKILEPRARSAGYDAVASRARLSCFDRG